MKIRFLGHSAVYMEDTGFKALIDPFLTGNSAAAAKPADFSDINYIFVTHGHGDHLGDTIEIAKKCGALVFCNFEISSYLAKNGVNVHAMHIGGRVKTDFGTLKMTPALHGSGIEGENGIICGGNPCGFVIEVGGKKVYHAGDTGLTMDMQLLKCENIDLALIPVGGNFTMDVTDGAKAVEFVSPKAVVPIHYDTFPLIKADIGAFEKSVPSGIKVIKLLPGEETKI